MNFEELADSIQELAHTHRAKRGRLLAELMPELLEACESLELDPAAVLPTLDRGESTAIEKIAEQFRSAT